MMLELNDREMALTKHALEFYLSGLRFEIGHTKKRDWKEGLHEEEDILNDVLGKIH
jgi:hypothetical protein